MEKTFKGELERAKNILGINSNKRIDEVELKKIYHKMMLKTHPDLNKKDDAKLKAQEINWAYDLLKKYFVRKSNSDDFKTENVDEKNNNYYQEYTSINEEIAKAIEYLKNAFTFDLISGNEYVIMQQEYLKGIYSSLVRDLKWMPLLKGISKKEINNKVISFKNEYYRVLHEIVNEMITLELPFISESDRNILLVKCKEIFKLNQKRSFKNDINCIYVVIDGFKKNSSIVKSKIVLWANDALYKTANSYSQVPGYAENIIMINKFKLELLAEINNIVQKPDFMENYQNNVEHIMELVNFEYPDFLSDIMVSHKDFLKQREYILNTIDFITPVNEYHENSLRKYEEELKSCTTAYSFYEIVEEYNNKFEHYKNIEYIKRNLISKLNEIDDLKVQHTAMEVVSTLDYIMKYEKFNVEYKFLSTISMDSGNFAKIVDLFKAKMLTLEATLSNKNISRKKTINHTK